MQCLSCDTFLAPETSICPSCGASQASSSTIDSPTTRLDTNPYKAYIPFVDGQVITRSPVSATQNEIAPSDHPSISPAPEQDTSPEPARKRGLLVTNIALFGLLLLLLAGESIGFLSTESSFRSTVLPAQATQVAQNLLETQAQNTAIAGSQATATATAMTPEQIYTWATSGTPVIDDPLNSLESTAWIDFSTKNGGCGFRDGSYHIFTIVPDDYACLAPGSFFHNFAFQAQITILEGDTGGIEFHCLGLPNHYLFFFTPQGEYVLNLVKNYQRVATLTQGNTSQLATGLGQPNLLTVVMLGSSIYLYINKVPVAQVMDTTYVAGQIGLFASSKNGPADVVFQNAKVWGL